MISDKKFEDILICPITQHKLSWLTEAELQQVNQRIRNGEIRQRSGESYLEPLKAALRSETDLFYPVVGDIFYLLPDCVLLGKQENQSYRTQIEITKNRVQSFYNNKGWQSEQGVYQDARDSEDLREVSKEYILQCHLRINRFLPPKGKYLLDVASGPIQYPAYLSYSQNFEYRICADISLQALMGAKKKLGDKGIYLLCDVTRLPIKDNVIDSVVSLHTLYHVPAQEQAKGFSEIHRVLKPGKPSVIVYSWGSRSILMNILLFPQKLFVLLKRKLCKPKSEASLYFYAHSFGWFNQEIQKKYQTKIYSWRSVNVPFLKLYIHRALAGTWLLKLLFKIENRFPEQMGKIGAYPLLVSVKK